MQDTQTFARDLRLAHGCTLCGGDIIEGGKEAPGVRWVPLARHTGGRVESIEVPVCGVCGPSLASTEGITALTVAVNARER